MRSHVSMYILMDQCAIVCSNVGKKCANNNKETIQLHVCKQQQMPNMHSSVKIFVNNIIHV